MGVAHAAQVLGLNRRQVYRIADRHRKEGDGAVVHRARGRPPNNAKSLELRKKVLERAQAPVFGDFGPTLLHEHLTRESELSGLLSVHVTTFRLWLIKAGRWQVRRQGRRHRQARPRRAALGELIQMDGSDHAWFEDRYPGRVCLLKMIDDATNRLLMARFVPRENGASCRQLIVDYLQRYGRPVALYVDKAGQYGQETRAHTPSVPLEERDREPTESIIRQALETLNIQLILANSPQAKGRVERDFGTSQDRLVKELRVAAISTLEGGNAFLETTFIPFWNERFAVQPASPKNLHRRLPKAAPLERLFAKSTPRSVANDFTVRWKNQRLQIVRNQAKGIRPRDKIVVEERLDGTTRFRFHNRYLELVPLAQPPKPGPRPKLPAAPAPKPKLPPRPRPAPLPPGPDHPWRRFPLRVGKARFTPAASRPALSTPSAPGG